MHLISFIFQTFFVILTFTYFGLQKLTLLNLSNLLKGNCDHQSPCLI